MNLLFILFALAASGSASKAEICTYFREYHPQPNGGYTTTYRTACRDTAGKWHIDGKETAKKESRNGK